MAVQAAASEPEGAPKLFLGHPLLTWSKIIPLGFMFFCILFNYTILRDTKVTESPPSVGLPVAPQPLC